MSKIPALAATMVLSLLGVSCRQDTSTPLGPDAGAVQRRVEPVPSQQSVVHLERIGDPIWRPVDFHLFSAPLGTPETGFAEFVATALALLPPPNHQFHPQLVVGPGAPHAPPYDAELAHGVAALGFEERRVFDASEFTGGNAVYLVSMVVPDPGTTGSSPDFTSGPIIPNTLFPITLTGVSTRNEELYDPALAALAVPALNDPTLTPRFDVDGHSHFPLFTSEASVFGPAGVDPAGEYKYAMTLTDQAGNGWAIQVRFVVRKKE